MKKRIVKGDYTLIYNDFAGLWELNRGTGKRVVPMGIHLSNPAYIDSAIEAANDEIAYIFKVAING